MFAGRLLLFSSPRALLDRHAARGPQRKKLNERHGTYRPVA
jgi:hypothetical protein